MIIVTHVLPSGKTVTDRHGKAIATQVKGPQTIFLDRRKEYVIHFETKRIVELTIEEEQKVA